MIGIAGAGGLGSNVAVNLVRSGITDIKIADFDIIEQSNLNRQFYFRDQIGQNKVNAHYENLKRINPSLNIKIVHQRLEKNNISHIFADCHIVVEAFDKKEYKSILIEELLSQKKLIVAGSGIAHHDLNNIETRKLRDNLYVVGDFTKGIDKYKTFSTKVSIVAATMANIVMDKGGFYERNE